MKLKEIMKLEYDLNIKAQYPELYLQRFSNLFYSLAIGVLALEIVTNTLRKSKMLKRNYYKRNKKYWRSKGTGKLSKPKKTNQGIKSRHSQKKSRH